mgnify:CR=1 FL=1
MIIDLILIGLYAIAVRFTRRALVPAIAFISTIAFRFIDVDCINYISSAISDFLQIEQPNPQSIMHMGYAGIYLVLIPLANTKVCMAMLLSAILNAVTVGYFLSSFWLESFDVYFAVLMIVVNLAIIFTVFRGLKNGQSSNVDHIVLFRVLDLCNVQTHSKTDARR